MPLGNLDAQGLSGLNPAALGLLELIRRAADLVDLATPQDDQLVNDALDVLGALQATIAGREVIGKVRRGEH